MRVGRGRCQVLINQVQEPGANLFRIKLIRSGSGVFGQATHGPQIMPLCRGAQVADPHLLDHSSAQR